MKRSKIKESKTTFTAYVDEVREIHSLFNEKTRYVVYAKWIMSEAVSTDPKKIFRIECKDYWDLEKISENDRLEFDALFSISEDGKDVIISNPYRLRQIE